MPGICGIVNGCSDHELGPDLADMISRMRHHPWYIEHTHVRPDVAMGRISLGFVNDDVQPARNEDGTFWAVMEGEIYNHAEECRRLTERGHVFRTKSHAELLLHGFEEEGQAFFRRLHGMFAAAIWDESKRRLMLTGDRFGMKPLYYAIRPGKLLLASEIKALLIEPGLSRGMHFRGLAQFFTYGQLLGEDTFFDGVRLLPAAGWLTFDANSGKVSLDEYWRLEPAKIASAGETEILDRIDEALQSAVQRRVQGTDRLGISLSGGLDARTILALVDPDQPLASVTMGVAGSIDHRSARELARLAGRPHHRYVLDTQFLGRFEDHLRWMVHLTDGHYLSQCIVVPTLPFYRQLGIEVLLRGHAGELMHMDKAYNFSLDARAMELRDAAGLESWLFGRLRPHMLEGAAKGLFAERFRAQIDDLARESLRECLRESEGLEPPLHRIWHMFLSQRLRRETAMSMVKFGSVVETRLPYLDNDVMEALLAAPPELKLGDKIQAHILRRHMPSFLGVVNSNTGAPLGAGAVARSLAKFRLKVFAKLRVPGYQPYERLGLWLRRELRPLVERLLLGRRCLDRGIFDPTAMNEIVQAHFAARANHTFLLLALMIFETGQREFVDGDQPGLPEDSEVLAPHRELVETPK